MVEGLPPAVQHRDNANPGPQVLRIGGDRGQGLGRGLEQEAVEPGLVPVGQGAEGCRQSEHHVVVGHRQQLGLARLQPGLGGRPLALGTMPVAAGVVGDAGVGTVGAVLDVAAQLRRAAELDRAHDAPLGEAEMPRVGVAPGGPEAAEDVRHLEPRPGHRAGSGRWRSSEVEQLERALHLPDRMQGNPGVARRRGDLPMPQQVLDHPDVDALLEQVGGEAVPAQAGSGPGNSRRRLTQQAS